MGNKLHQGIYKVHKGANSGMTGDTIYTKVYTRFSMEFTLVWLEENIILRSIYNVLKIVWVVQISKRYTNDEMLYTECMKGRLLWLAWILDIVMNVIYRVYEREVTMDSMNIGNSDECYRLY